MPKNKKIKIVLQLLGVMIFIYILFKIDYRIFLENIKVLKWQFLILAAGFMVLEIIIRSLRWRCVLSSLEIRISALSALSLQWLGFFLGIITPGRFGELIKIYFLEHKGYSVFRSFFSIVIDRLIDILVLLILGFFIFLFFLKSIGIYLVIFGLVALLAVVIVFTLMNQRSYLHQLIGRFIKKIFPFDFNDYNHFTPDKFWQGLKNLKPQEAVYFFIYLVAGWWFYFLARYAIALSLGLNLSFTDIAITSVLVAIVSALPISIAGLGTREAVVIYSFGLFGLNKETALLFSLLLFTIDLMVTAIGLIPYSRESFLINQVKRNEVQ